MKIEKILATFAALSMLGCFFSAIQGLVYIITTRTTTVFAFITAVQSALLVTAGLFLGGLLIVSIKDIMDNRRS